MESSTVKGIILTWIRSSLVRQFAANSVWMTIARCLWILGAFTVGILVARHLGPHDFGIINYAVAYVGMFSIITNLGVDGLVERDFILHPENRNRILGNYFLFKLVTTGIMLLAVAFSLCFFTDRTQLLFCAVAAAGYIFYPMNAVSIVFSSLIRNEYNAFAQIITCFVYNGLRLWAVLSAQSLLVYIILEAVLIGLNALLFFLFYCWKCGNPFHWTWNWKESFLLIIPAVPLSISGILSSVYVRTDILMLEHYRGAASVGYYTIATRFTENWSLFINLFASVFSMAVISGFKHSPEEYHKQLQRYIFMLFYISFPPVILSLLLGKPVILFLYGADYAPAIHIFYVFVLTLLTQGIMNAFVCHAINETRLKTIALISLSGVLINIPVNILMIRLWGECGAALSSLISMPLGFAFVLMFTKKGREDLRFILYSLTHLPSFKLNQ